MRSSRKNNQTWTGQASCSRKASSWFCFGVSPLHMTNNGNVSWPDVKPDFSQQSLQNWLYYFVSTKTDNISELSRFTGILRGQESFAQAVSFGINTRDWYGGRVPLAVNTILLGESRSHWSEGSHINGKLGLSVVPTWIAVREHTPMEADKNWGSEEEQVHPEVVGDDEKTKIAVVKSNARWA